MSFMSLPLKPFAAVLSDGTVDHSQFQEETVITFSSLSALLELQSQGCHIERVYVHLMAIRFDAFTVAGALQEAQFGGTLTVLHPPLPKPKMVLRELETAFPNLCFEFQYHAEDYASLKQVSA